jgi:hypothetical protein
LPLQGAYGAQVCVLPTCPLRSLPRRKHSMWCMSLTATTAEHGCSLLPHVGQTERGRPTICEIGNAIPNNGTGWPPSARIAPVGDAPSVESGKDRCAGHCGAASVDQCGSRLRTSITILGTRVLNWPACVPPVIGFIIGGQALGLVGSLRSSNIKSFSMHHIAIEYTTIYRMYL